MTSPDTIDYEHDSRMDLSRFQKDSSLFFILVSLPENAQETALYYLHSHLKTTVKLHITVFSEVTEYKTLNRVCMFHIFTAFDLCNSNLLKALCKRKKYTLIYNKHTIYIYI